MHAVHQSIHCAPAADTLASRPTATTLAAHTHRATVAKACLGLTHHLPPSFHAWRSSCSILCARAPAAACCSPGTLSAHLCRDRRPMSSTAMLPGRCSALSSVSRRSRSRIRGSAASAGRHRRCCQAGVAVPAVGDGGRQLQAAGLFEGEWAWAGAAAQVLAQRPAPPWPARRAWARPRQAARASGLGIRHSRTRQATAGYVQPASASGTCTGFYFHISQRLLPRGDRTLPCERTHGWEPRAGPCTRRRAFVQSPLADLRASTRPRPLRRASLAALGPDGGVRRSQAW